MGLLDRLNEQAMSKLVALAAPQIEQMVGELNANVVALNQHLARIGENTAAVAARLAAVEHGQNAIVARLSNLNDRLDTLTRARSDSDARVGNEQSHLHQLRLAMLNPNKEPTDVHMYNPDAGVAGE